VGGSVGAKPGRALVIELLRDIVVREHDCLLGHRCWSASATVLTLHI
jgi:hypothetical protein